MNDRQIDPRGPRFVAAITMVVLAIVLVTENPYLLGFQAIVFGLGAGFGTARSPYGLLFRFLVRPWLRPPAELESAAPPRFAQGVGLAFAIVGLIGYVVGATLVGALTVALALLAAFLNAVFGLCIGCECYLLLVRAFPSLRRSP